MVGQLMPENDANFGEVEPVRQLAGNHYHPAQHAKRNRSVGTLRDQKHRGMSQAHMSGEVVQQSKQVSLPYGFCIASEPIQTALLMQSPADDRYRAEKVKEHQHA